MRDLQLPVLTETPGFKTENTIEFILALATQLPQHSGLNEMKEGAALFHTLLMSVSTQPMFGSVS